MIEIFLDCLPISAIYFLGALAFGLVWSTTRDGLFHLAMGGIFVLSAGVFNNMILRGIPVVPAIVVAVVTAMIVGIVIEGGVYRILRHYEKPSEMYLLASFGALIVIERTTRAFLGAMPLYLPSHEKIDVPITILGSHFSGEQLTAIACAITICMISSMLFVGRSGQQLSAIRQSSVLYDWRIGSSSVCLTVVACCSSAVVALAAVLFHLQHRVVIEQAAMGFFVPSFITVLAAGGTSKCVFSIIAVKDISPAVERMATPLMYGLTAIAVSFTESMVTIKLEPTWKDSALLILAIAVLLMGRRHRITHRVNGGKQ